VARLIADTVKRKPDAVLGLATGRTPEQVYQRLCEMHRSESLDFSHVTTFNLDEYIGIPAAHPQSYRSTMQKALFDHINNKRERTFLPDGMASDLEAGCSAYEQAIERAGGIDLQLLGIGLNGHLAFNEPLSSLTSRTRTKSLTPETRQQNSSFFGGAEKVPSRAITMGVGTILESRWCVLLATGDSKAEILQRAIEGPVQSVITASALQMHRRCTVIVDEPAASKLQHREYYRWVFGNEPEWAPYRAIVHGE
jgi:glucosamine-6-phosphate deaminase